MRKRGRMGRRRQYASDAERQRASRERLKAEWPRVNGASLKLLHERLERLERAVRRAAAGGEPAAQASVAISAETVLDKLASYFEGCSGNNGAPEKKQR
jgi:hypothetical protein